MNRKVTEKGVDFFLHQLSVRFEGKAINNIDIYVHRLHGTFLLLFVSSLSSSCFFEETKLLFSPPHKDTLPVTFCVCAHKHIYEM